MKTYTLNALCGIEVVGDGMLETDKEYPKLEESTVGEDESLENLDQPQNDDEVIRGSPDLPDKEMQRNLKLKLQRQKQQEEEEEQENSLSSLVVCFQSRVDPLVSVQDESSSYSERPDRCGSTTAALCASTYQYPESPRATLHRLNSQNTREILDRSDSKLLLFPQVKDYPEDAPNLLEDCDFEILAPQDEVDEGQAEEVQVLNPDIMEDLQSHLPLTKKGESFWLQYSLIRDGASMDSLLFKIRNTDHCVLAIETVDGDVFGAYTSRRWRYHDDFFGSRDAFLWRKNSDPKEGEEDVECFHYSYLNQDVQLCTHDRLAVGGGIRKFDPQYGFGISLDRDLLTGTTSKSMTFLNPPLSSKHADGTTFEVRNVEVWALTPCLSLEDAERVQNKPIWA